MGTRRSASTLSPPEIDRFVAAVDSLKQPDGTGVSRYDRFVALHGAVMEVRVTFAGGAFQRTNMAHWNIGFCPWHRQYLLDFEQALQSVDPDVDLPYWDWDNHPQALSQLFAGGFAGSLGDPSGPADVVDGGFANFPIVQPLEEDWGTLLERGGGPTTGWPPSAGALAWLEDLRFSSNGRHPLWIFWRLLEAGWPGLLTSTHNAAHNYVGGHMAGAFSPNDPVFWMHHANVDRIWANWQRRFLDAEAVGHPGDWPAHTETSPLDGRPAPYGHRIGDLMWPWVGRFAGAFESLSVSPAAAALLPDPAALPEVRVTDVLDIAQLGYDYA